MLPLSEMRSASIWLSVILSDRLRLGLGSTPQTVVRFMIYPTEKNPTGISSGSDAYRIFFYAYRIFFYAYRILRLACQNFPPPVMSRISFKPEHIPQ